jgi:hypothetical protein
MVDLAFVRAAGVHFDESLDWYEDWQFWLAPPAHTRFVRSRDDRDLSTRLSASGIETSTASGETHGPARRDAVLARAPSVCALLTRHDALSAGAAHSGPASASVAAWVAAHQDYHYDAEPLLHMPRLLARGRRTHCASSTAASRSCPTSPRSTGPGVDPGRAGDRNGAAGRRPDRRTRTHGPVSPSDRYKAPGGPLDGLL